MKELEFIDDYFAGRLSPTDQRRFETALHDNFPMAEAVAFYLLTRQIAYQETQKIVKPMPVRKLPAWTYGAIAACLLLVIGLSFYLYRGVSQKPSSAIELADRFLIENYNQLPTTLDGNADSLKTGVTYFNISNLKDAHTVFESILKRQPNHPAALKFAGIVSLRLKKYDQAISHFHQLGLQADLYSNPGIFLEAVAYLKRGQPMDKNRAENLLRTVIQGNLEGKVEAEELVEKLKAKN